MSRITYWLALVWTIGVTIFLLVVPIYGEKMTWIETTPSGEKIQHTEPGSSTLLDINGPRVLTALAIPLLLVAAPLLALTPSRRKIALLFCGFVLLLFAVLGSWSIGPFYYPAALALLISAAAIRPKKA